MMLSMLSSHCAVATVSTVNLSMSFAGLMWPNFVQKPKEMVHAADSNGTAVHSNGDLGSPSSPAHEQADAQQARSPNKEVQAHIMTQAMLTTCLVLQADGMSSLKPVVMTETVDATEAN